GDDAEDVEAQVDLAVVDAIDDPRRVGARGCAGDRDLEPGEVLDRLGELGGAVAERVGGGAEARLQDEGRRRRRVDAGGPGVRRGDGGVEGWPGGVITTRRSE